MIIESGEQLDLISQGYTTITAQGSGQNIELAANKDITFTATDVVLLMFLMFILVIVLST